MVSNRDESMWHQMAQRWAFLRSKEVGGYQDLDGSRPVIGGEVCLIFKTKREKMKRMARTLIFLLWATNYHHFLVGKKALLHQP